MANIAQVLKEEIARISRKEARKLLEKLQKDNARLKHDAAELKRRVSVRKLSHFLGCWG